MPFAIERNAASPRKEVCPRRFGLNYSAMIRATLTALVFCAAALAQQPDPQLAAYIDTIQAIDNHAHVFALDIPDDKGYDALRCEELPPSVGPDPANFRFGEATKLAWQALYGVEPASSEEADLIRPQMLAKIEQQQGDKLYDWLLDKAGVQAVLANRVSMTPGLKPPHFLWVPYDDALLFPLNNDGLKKANPDRASLFAQEDQVRATYFRQSGVTGPPPTLDGYLAKVVRPTLERQKQAGAIAIKFEAAYLRSLHFERASPDAATAIYARSLDGPPPGPADYKILQDFLFHEIALEAGHLGLAVHIHTGEGGGSYFNVAGSNPMLLEPLLDDPSLRRTNFVFLHGGWPFERQLTALFTKPNVYADFSAQDLLQYPAELSKTIRAWLEYVPEKALFATDAYPYSAEAGWEETGYIAAATGRQALAIALTGMLRDGEVNRARASELARMVLRDNARALYKLK